MTTQSNGRSVTTACNGVSANFAVPFQFLQAADLKVYLLDDPGHGNDEGTLLSEGVDYVVVGSGRAGNASIITTIAYAAGKYIRRWRDTDRDQEADYVPNDGFPADSHETQLDRLSLIAEELDWGLADLRSRTALVKPGRSGATAARTSNGEILSTAAGSMAWVTASEIKGDPGGNIMAVGLFTSIPFLEIPEGTDMIHTAGHTVLGKGAAFMIRDDAVTVESKAASEVNDRTQQIDALGAGWRLYTTHATPFEFGALGSPLPEWEADGDEFFTCVNEGEFTDDYDPVQACLDYQHHYPETVIDLSVGHWAISQELSAVYPYIGWPLGRRFIGGRFYLLQGFTGDHGITIGGHGQLWAQPNYVDGGTRSYSYRRCPKALVRLFNANNSIFTGFYVEGSKRHGVLLDPTDTSTTFRAGSDYEVTFSNSNNIGIKIGFIWGRTNGYSTTWDLELAYPDTQIPFTAVNGGANSNTLEWDGVSAAATFNNSHLQRSKLTVAAASDFEPGDLVKTRNIMFASEIIGYAADATAGTFTLTAGDPVAAGFQVGDRFRPSHGPNGGIKYRIKGFGGTSNRTVTVSPKPASTHAALVLPAHGYVDGGFDHYAIQRIDDDEMLIFPWLNPRVGLAGEFEGAFGAVFACLGNNTANVEVGLLYGYGNGVTFLQNGLYGPKIGTLLAEYCEVGFQHAFSLAQSSSGTVIGHAHFEGVHEDIVQLTGSGSFTLEASSSFAGAQRDALIDVTAIYPRSEVTSLEMASRTLSGAMITYRGEIFASKGPESYQPSNSSTWSVESGFAVSNRPGRCDRHYPFNGGTITLEWFDHIAARFGEHHRARVLWTSPTNGVPSGTLTIEPSDAMEWDGWAIAGSGVIATPATALEIHILFNAATKTVSPLSLPMTPVA